LLHNGEACRLHILTIAAFLQLARGEHSLAAQYLPPVVHGVLPNRQPGASIVCDETLWLLGLRFLPSLITKSPIVLESEGLGPKPYDGRIVLLVDRHTASAAEMVTIFAKENKLATIVGEKTAGRLLSATSVKVGHGFRLAFPTGAYYTWNGTALEGSPIEPDVVVDFSWQDRRNGVDVQLQKALEQIAE
jgi:carboxyl-terminal processing protease